MSKSQRVQLGVTAKAAALTQRNVHVLSLMGETFHMSTLMMAGDIPCGAIYSCSFICMTLAYYFELKFALRVND